MTEEKNEIVAKPHPEVFPYLITRLVSAFYHLTVLPRCVSFDQLMQYSRAQQRANQLEVCLVISADAAIYFRVDGEEVPRKFIPAGGTLVTGQLRSCQAIIEAMNNDKTYLPRVAAVEKYIENLAQAGYIMGDPTRGGRPATPEEKTALSGVNDFFKDVPRGLFQCSACKMYCGECLDTCEANKGQLIRVHCQCDNKNKCAQCDAVLGEYKLNANHFDPSDGKIWHLAAFVALSHECARQKEPLGFYV